MTAAGLRDWHWEFLLASHRSDRHANLAARHGVDAGEPGNFVCLLGALPFSEGGSLNSKIMVNNKGTNLLERILKTTME